MDAVLDPFYYLEERYTEPRNRSPALSVYYAVRPLLPSATRLAMRRAFARWQARRDFPAWPIEPVLVELEHSRFRELLRGSGSDRVPFVNYWPDRRRFCAVLTHDVESDRGIRNIPRVLEVEQRHGFASAWYFVAEDYAIPKDLFSELREAGCEIGLHGIRHDGKLFESRRRFEASLPKIRRYLREWDGVGFRSPSLHRNPEWMRELGALYDSSFPDTDPFEPQAGGCCSIFPYFLGETVELPVTLAQDHTLWEILGDVSPDRWIQKAEWIIRHHGMVNLIVHPDYVNNEDRLDVYEEFLRFLARQEDCWRALPRDVAHWWRARENIAGDANPLDVVARHPELRASVAYAHERDGQILIDT